MAKKYYAVKQGVVPGIYESWAECEAQVKGFSGAMYKSFPTLEDARAYLGEVAKEEAVHTSEDLLARATEKMRAHEHRPILDPGHAVAYVDGSNNPSTGEYSYGVALFVGDNYETFSQKFQDELSEMRNVAGEIRGAAQAMHLAHLRGVKVLQIHYDYQGIEAWANGSWKTNKEGTKKYKSYYDKMAKLMTIKFVKEAAHTGVYYNEVADRLAKDALGIK